MEVELVGHGPGAGLVGDHGGLVGGVAPAAQTRARSNRAAGLPGDEPAVGGHVDHGGEGGDGPVEVADHLPHRPRTRAMGPRTPDPMPLMATRSSSGPRASARLAHATSSAPAAAASATR